MSGLKKIKDRIKSVKLTRKITKTMQMIATVKLQKFRNLLLKDDDYSSMLCEMMDDLAKINNQIENYKNIFAKDANFPEDLKIMILFTSNRGLCGGSNSTVIKSFADDLSSIKENLDNVRVTVLGNKGGRWIEKHYPNVISKIIPNPGYSELIVEQIVNDLLSLIDQEITFSCYLYYNKFVNIATHSTTRKRILPIIPETNERYSKYEYESIDFRNILKFYLTAEISSSLLQSSISEEGARMLAMDNATNSADELIDNFTSTVNKIRQANVTNELNEMIAGSQIT